MSKIIFFHQAEGLFGESVTLRLEKDKSVTISVFGPPRVDENYVELGESASMRLPADQVQTLAEAVLDAIPQ